MLREKIRHVEYPEIDESNVEQFRYTKVISNLFQFRGAVDDNNKKKNGWGWYSWHVFGDHFEGYKMG